MGFGQVIIPSLRCLDIGQTRAFYVDRLGFTLSGAWPATEPTWIEVSRDGITLQFSAEPCQGEPDAPVMSGVLYFRPDSVRDVASALSSDVDVAWGPEVMPYGMLEFAIRDPNGYILAFTEPAAAEGPGG